jgi:hypothetical protein
VLERFRRRRRIAVVTVVVVASAVVGAGLLAADDGHDPCKSPRVAPPAETGLLPQGLSFDRIGQVTRVRKDGQNVSVHGVTTKPLDQATVLIQDAVTKAGYQPAGMDTEGFEAEVFFNAGRYAGGQALLRQTACAGRWDIVLVLLDRH